MSTTQRPHQSSPEFASITDMQVKLNGEFKLDLSDHQLIDPDTNRGMVVDVVDGGNVLAFDKVVPVKEIRVLDSFILADPEGYYRIKEHVEGMEYVLRSSGYDPLIERQQRYPYSKDLDENDHAGRKQRRHRNQFTEAWLHDPNVAALNAWHSLIPSALALGYLTNPWVGIEIERADGERFVSTPETAAYLRFVDDAVAIRNRAIAMQSIAETHLRDVMQKGQHVEWLDLASGTAEPSIAAAKTVSDVDGLSVALTVVDQDQKALNFVGDNAQKQGFKGKLTVVHDFITVPTFTDNVKTQSGVKDGYDVVENLGFEEYLPERDLQDGLGSDELGAYRDMSILPNASDFTRWAYDLVKPGGVLISGNMVLERPQRDFVFGIVNWPIINARSEESILRVYKRAGILDDLGAKIEMYRVVDELTNVHIYNIVKITKS